MSIPLYTWFLQISGYQCFFWFNFLYTEISWFLCTNQMGKWYIQSDFGWLNMKRISRSLSRESAHSAKLKNYSVMYSQTKRKWPLTHTEIFSQSGQIKPNFVFRGKQDRGPKGPSLEPSPKGPSIGTVGLFIKQDLGHFLAIFIWSSVNFFSCFS